MDCKNKSKHINPIVTCLVHHRLNAFKIYFTPEQCAWAGHLSYILCLGSDELGSFAACNLARNSASQRYLHTIILHIQMSFTHQTLSLHSAIADEAIITLKNLVLISVFTSHHNLWGEFWNICKSLELWTKRLLSKPGWQWVTAQGHYQYCSHVTPPCNWSVFVKML